MLESKGVNETQNKRVFSRNSSFKRISLNKDKSPPKNYELILPDQ